MMKEKEFSFISIEEQLKEASQDVTGKIMRYLELAEKLFNCDRNATANTPNSL